MLRLPSIFSKKLVSRRTQIVLILLIGLCAFLVFWPFAKPAGFKQNVGGTYYVQQFTVRSFLRVVSETVHFMPHGRVRHWGTSYGYKTYLCRSGTRVVEVSRLAHRPAAALSDGSRYAYFSPDEPDTVRVINARTGFKILKEKVLTPEQLQRGKAMLRWKDSTHLEILEYVVELSAVKPPRLIKEIVIE